MIITCPSCATQFRVDGTRISASGTKVRCARCGHVWLQTPDEALPYVAPAPKAAAPAPPPPEPEPPKPVEAFAPDPPQAAMPEPPAEAEPEPEVTRPSPFPVQPFRSSPFSDEPVPSLRPPPAPARVERPAKAPPVRPMPPVQSMPSGAEEGGRRPLPIRSIARLSIVAVIFCAFALGLLYFRPAIVGALPVTGRLYCALGFEDPVNELKVQPDKDQIKRTFVDGMPYLEFRGHVINKSKRTVAVPPVRVALRDKAGKNLYSWIVMASPHTLAPSETADFASRIPSPAAEAAQLAFALAPCGTK